MYSVSINMFKIWANSCFGCISLQFTLLYTSKVLEPFDPYKPKQLNLSKYVQLSYFFRLYFGIFPGWNF